ncbi:MAG: hypothetical protein ACYCW6_30465 [Candidatus Xenobia bacterium]
MADDSPGSNLNVLRIIGFAMLGLALVLALVLGADQVAEEDATDIPPWWRGPHEVGVIQSFTDHKLTIVRDDGRTEEFVCDKNTRYTARGEPFAPDHGVRCIIIFRNSKPKIAKIVRTLPPQASPSPLPSETSPRSATASSSPSPSASPSP